MRPLRDDQYQAICSVSLLADALVRFNISPLDILAFDAPLFGFNGEWEKVYYYAVAKMVARTPLS